MSTRLAGQDAQRRGNCPYSLRGPRRSGLGVLFEGFAAWKGWRYVTPALGFLALAAFSSYRELSGLLASTHLPGAGSYGVGSLAKFGFHPDATAPSLILKTWNDAAGGDPHRPAEIIHWAIYVDFGFLFFYCALLGLWLVKVGGGLRSLLGDEEAITRRAQRRIDGSAVAGVDLDASKGAVRRLIDRYRRVVAIALLFALPALAVADLAENGFTLGVVNCEGRGFYWGLFVFAWIKTALFLFVLASALIATVALASFRREARHQIIGTLAAVRAQLLIALSFSALLLFDPTGQADDAIRHWEPDFTQSLAPLLVTLLLAALIAVDARALLERSQLPRWPAAGYGKWGPSVLLGCGAALVGIGLGANSAWTFGIGLVVLGGILLVIGGLSLLVHGMDPEPPGTTITVPALSPLLAMVPPIALGSVIFRASFSELAYSGRSDYDWLIGAGLSLQLIGWYLYPALRIAAGDANTLLRVAFRVVALGASLVFFIWTIVDPWGFAPAVGTVGIVAAAALGLALGASLLVWLAERLQPPQAFQLLRLRRTPVFTLVLVWAIVAAVVDRTGSYYDVRTLPPVGQDAGDRNPALVCNPNKPSGTIARRMHCHDLTAGEVLDRWIEQNAPLLPSRVVAEGSPSKPAVPLIFVASEGGGIRAAYWTAIVLRCAFEGHGASFCPAKGPARRLSPVFAASGVSGGALGLVAYTAHVEAGTPEQKWPGRLDHDFAAPTLAWALFVDLPLSLIRRGGGTDRAEVLERAWERGWEGGADQSALADGLYAQWSRSWTRTGGPALPLLLLNGTRVQDGCRYESSVILTAVGSGPTGLPASALRSPLFTDCRALRLFERDAYDPTYVVPSQRATWILGATTDLAADLCPGEDVRLSTAALLAARFPYVTPSGRLQRPKSCGGGPSVNVVDGGYFENSATSTATELWGSLRDTVAAHNRKQRATCIVPVLLEINNHYLSGPGPQPAGRPWESAVPLATLGSGRDARDAQARQAAAIAFGQASFGGLEATVKDRVVDRFAHIYPRAHAGTEAPLGWTLSEAARKDLEARLREDAAPELRKVQDWLSGSLTCTRVTKRAE